MGFHSTFGAGKAVGIAAAAGFAGAGFAGTGFAGTVGLADEPGFAGTVGFPGLAGTPRLAGAAGEGLGFAFSLVVDLLLWAARGPAKRQSSRKIRNRTEKEGRGNTSIASMRPLSCGKSKTCSAQKTKPRSAEANRGLKGLQSAGPRDYFTMR